MNFFLDARFVLLYYCINELIQFGKEMNYLSWQIDNARPIYPQLMEKIELEIIAGTFPPGSRLPSVRELAIQANVNPNTMQKALSELERIRLLHTERTSGRYITNDTKLIADLRQSLAEEEIRKFTAKMASLQYDQKETLSLLNAISKEHTNG